MLDKPIFIRWFTDIRLDDVAIVGGQNASPGELYRELSHAGVRVPNGFAICAQAPSDYPEFAAFLVECGIDSMSLNLDAVLPTTRAVLELEATRAAATACVEPVPAATRSEIACVAR